jgi:hypothetical protein
MFKVNLRKMILAVVTAGIVSSAALAAIVPISNNFVGASSISGWYALTGSPAILHLDSTVAQYDWTDNDDSVIQTALNYGDPIPTGGSATGDGVVADGAMKFDVKNTTRGDERIAYNLSGTIQNGEVLTFTYHLFNNAAYWNQVTGYFYDLTDGVQLTDDSWITCLATNVANYNPASNVATYTGTAETAGHQIAIVFREWGSTTARDPYVDAVSVTSVIPEPATIALFGLAAILFRRK